MKEAALKPLEAFVLDNDDLERLEALVNPFNIFESIGAVRQELRHSDFLAYLLDPHQNHGLQDLFVKRLLQRAVSRNPDTSILVNSIELDTWDLNQLEVSREWQNIDILLRDEENKLVVAIENKIGITEHSDQLERYWQIVSDHFPKWKAIGLYLTPDGERPSHQKFLPIDYGLIATLLEGLTVSRASVLGADVRTLITHYIQMLRRHIVSESEIAELCRRIYRKHKQALDLIFEHRPDQLAVIQEFLETLIREIDGLVLDSGSKRYIRFAHKDWDSPKLQQGKGWTASGRILLFEFQNQLDSLKLKLIIGPGPREIREGLFQMATNKQPPFKPASKTLMAQWNEIFSRPFLSPKSYEDANDDQLKTNIRQQWERFLVSDLREICKTVEAVK